MSDTDLVTISFRVPTSLRERLEEASRREHRTVSNFLRMVLEERVPALEAEETRKSAD